MDNESDLTGDGGVVKTIFKEAKTDAIGPTKNLPLVDVHYVASVAGTDEVLFNTYEDEDGYSFVIGTGSVIKGLEIALKTMKVDEIAIITCKPDYAYGSAGSPPEIPRNATLIFEVQLLACRPRECKRRSKAAARLEDPEKYSLELAARERKNKEFVDARDLAAMKKWEAEVVDGEYDITGDGGVVKKIIRKGEAGAIGPTQKLSLIEVWYRGYTVKLETGQVTHYPCGDGTLFSFKLGVGSVAAGWDIAVRTMKVGDIATITCKPYYAYGEEGRLPEIPPNATVIYTLELVACRPWNRMSSKDREFLYGEPTSREEGKGTWEGKKSAAFVAAAAAWDDAWGGAKPAACWEDAKAAAVAAAVAAAKAWEDAKGVCWEDASAWDAPSAWDASAAAAASATTVAWDDLKALEDVKADDAPVNAELDTTNKKNKMKKNTHL